MKFWIPITIPIFYTGVDVGLIFAGISAAAAVGSTIISATGAGGGGGGGEVAPLPPMEEAPTPPAVPTPEMPTPDSAAIEAARRQSMVQQAQRRGRASTILTSYPETVGETETFG